MNKIADDQLDEDFYSNYKQKSYISNSILSERLRNLRRESGKRSPKAPKTTNSRDHEKPSFHTERYSILSLLKGSLIDFNVAVDTSHVAIDMDKCKSVLINQLCSFTVDTKDNSQQGSVKVAITSESKLLEMVFLSAKTNLVLKQRPWWQPHSSQSYQQPGQYLEDRVQPSWDRWELTNNKLSAFCALY